MTWWSDILNLFFPSPFTEKDLRQIPAAPSVAEPYCYALFDYRSAKGKKLVYFIKKYRDKKVSRVIALLMKEYLEDVLSEYSQFSLFQDPLVIPIPISPKTLKHRGFNQNEDIARALAEILDVHYSPTIVKKCRETKKQALLHTRRERKENVHDSFKVFDPTALLINRDIIIVDDLITTGATLGEMMRVLKKHKARTVLAITLAH